jgi:3-oxoadipate enol-lactonase
LGNNRYIIFLSVLFAILATGCNRDSGSGDMQKKEDIDNTTDMSMTDDEASQSGIASINGAEIHYEIAGTGPALVMLHAGVADSRMWRAQVGFFSQYYKVITYDLRGFGKSGMPAGPYAHYLDLAALLDTLGCDNSILLGWSMGGSVAIDFALEFPGRVRGLILSGSAVDGYRMEDERTKEYWTQIDKAIEAGELERAAELEIEQWIIGDRGAADRFGESDLDLFREMLVTHYQLDQGQGEEQGPDKLSIDRLGEIRVPTMIVVGDLDSPDILKIADILERDIPNAKKSVIHSTAHLPSFEKPDEFNELVFGFLRNAGL